MTARLFYLILMLVALCAICFGASRPIMICQKDYESIQKIRVCNFGTSPVTATPPDTWTPDGPVVCDDIPMPEIRIPPPPTLCDDDPHTTYLEVPNTLSPPGKPNRLAAWAYSKWNVRSGISNVIAPPTERMTAPKML